ncbi:RagB/SusD family nutrient uptake outer membrane protein [Pedobacter glucosidilyticus]|uniref:RagB/SusD family nutrient uptake outer membrane protein n=1 Tax=Pedobacter glucosidilyticus TaxID=1122941 RepID=UPI00041C1D22|nr:RagB/SusD family nutrient uptake outer membrane protein [Pedobacter glucosidilyticus]
MKKIKNIFFTISATIFLLVSGSGCSFLERDPLETVAPDNFWRNQKDVEAFMAGVYNSLQTTLRTNWFDWGEVRSDNVTRAGTGTAQTKLLNNVLAGNDNDLNSITDWTNLYRTISLCNTAINRLPPMIESNVAAGEVLYRDKLGQAYAIRAMLYFYALRVWGGVPIVDTPIESVTEQINFPRATVAEVKAQILSDLDGAIANIGGNTAIKFYIQRPAVYALKTDVHMWFQEYNEAISASNNISGYSWVTNGAGWKNIFLNPEASTETIFNLYWDAVEFGNEGIGVCQKFGSGSNTSQYTFGGNVIGKYYNRVDPVTNRKLDSRLWNSVDTVLYPTLAIYETTVEKFGKFMAVDPVTNRFTYIGNDQCNVKLPIYRYADVMLLRAEALARTGSHQQALDIVNAVRNRVGYTIQARLSDYSGTSDQIGIAIQRTVLEERQLELLGEGKRWFDLCRIGNIYDYSLNGYEYLREIMNPVLSSRAGSVVYNSNEAMGRILYPINSAVINANPLLRGKQNPPYSE